MSCSSSLPLVPGCLTGLSDVDQAEQVHQFKEHDHQADDANSLKSLRFPPHTHLPFFFYRFFHSPFLFLVFSFLHYHIIRLLTHLSFSPSVSSSLTLSVLFLSLKQCHSLITLFLSQFFLLLLYLTLTSCLFNWLPFPAALSCSNGSFGIFSTTKSRVWWPLLRSSWFDYCCKIYP